MRAIVTADMGAPYRDADISDYWYALDPTHPFRSCEIEWEEWPGARIASSLIIGWIIDAALGLGPTPGAADALAGHVVRAGGQ